MKFIFSKNIFNIERRNKEPFYSIFMYICHIYLYNKNILVEIAGTDGKYWAHSNH